jgi:ABC-type sugar transport system ATPase subunit
MVEPFLELRNIHKHFSGVHALNDMSLAIRPGEIHCLAGENGSGKSTLIKVIAGSTRPTPDHHHQRQDLLPAHAHQSMDQGTRSSTRTSPSSGT